MSNRYLSLLDEKNVSPSLGKVDLAFFEHCIMGKHHRQAFSVGTHNFTELLEYVHGDITVPSLFASLSEKLYFVSFIDDYSMYVGIFFIHKSEVFTTLKILMHTS